jgi:hypothetical protein
MRKWLTSLVGGRPALQIDLRCDALIRALEGGYVFRQQQGRILPIPRDDAHAAVVEALVVALAAPAVTMTLQVAAEHGRRPQCRPPDVPVLDAQRHEQTKEQASELPRKP